VKHEAPQYAVFSINTSDSAGVGDTSVVT